jgi:hypothetical protein
VRGTSNALRVVSLQFGPDAARGPSGSCFFLWTSALIKLASMENPAPPTRPAAMHFATTLSNTRRNASLWRKRSCPARLNTEWSGIPSSIPSWQNHRYARLTCASEHSRRPSGSQTRSPQSASGSSTPDQLKADLFASSRAQAPCVPNQDRERRRSARSNDRSEHLVEIERIKELTLSALSPLHHRPLPRSTS